MAAGRPFHCGYASITRALILSVSDNQKHTELEQEVKAQRQKRCHGRNISLKRCGRVGDWRLFCSDHKYQWITFTSFIVFTVIAGAASISGLFPIAEYLWSDKVEVAGDNSVYKAINKAKMEGVTMSDARDNALLGKIFARPAAEMIDTEDNSSHFAVTLISPFRPLGTSYTYKSDDCRFLGKASYFDEVSDKGSFFIYVATCSRNDGSHYRSDAREMEGVKKIGYISLPGMSGDRLIPLSEEGGVHTLPKDTNVEIFLDYNVARFVRVW